MLSAVLYEHFMRRQVVAARENRRSPTVVRRLTGACWPGGGQDRMEPMAAIWLSQWRPATAAAYLPACECSTRRCKICN